MVTISVHGSQSKELRFQSSLRIGRAPDCDIPIDDDHVSRYHLELFPEKGHWRLRDLGSRNGIFLGGDRIEELSITSPIDIRLGIEGPLLSLRLDAAKSQSQHGPKTALYIARYFSGSSSDSKPGEHTRMIRHAYQQVQAKQRRRYGVLLAVLLTTLAAAVGYSFYGRKRISQQTMLAQDLFYAIKTLDVDLAHLEKLISQRSDVHARQEVKKFQTRRKSMEQSYDGLLTSLNVYDPRMNEEQRLILRVARVFGECELTMPPDFATEVHQYVRRWQATKRFQNAIEVARKNRYVQTISAELLSQDLPPHFFYLALQESGLDPYVSGPMTRKGIAKGMWQFIPETAVRYGLRIGPLTSFPRPDPKDDRHNWKKSTAAAARYLKDLYATDAQGSGLLVMASYNWGENKVLPLIRSMPPNPRDRNFWRLLKNYRTRLPKETYDYVFYIFSAAVIGENPPLFGFKFGSPLESIP